MRCVVVWIKVSLCHLNNKTNEKSINEMQD